MVLKLFVYNEPVGETASLATQALSGHRLRTSRQLKAKQSKCLLARPNMVTSAKQPPVERLASLVSPRAGAHPGPPSGRTTEHCRAPALPVSALGTKRGRGTQDWPFLGLGPSPACPLPPPALVSVHKPLIKQAWATFPLIPPPSPW